VLPKHGSMLGASARVSAALALLATAVSATAMVLGGATFATVPGASVLMAFVGGGGEGVQAAAGIKCALFELMFAAPPLALGFGLARRRWFARPAIALAAAAAGGALVAQAVLHIACHAQPSTTHNLVFHTLPVLLATALGALAGRRIRPPAA
jgi:hypothetical protein